MGSKFKPKVYKRRTIFETCNGTFLMFILCLLQINEVFMVIANDSFLQPKRAKIGQTHSWIIKHNLCINSVALFPPTGLPFLWQNEMPFWYRKQSPEIR